MRIVLIILLVVITANVMAQDTSKKREVQVTSSFKPVLKEAAKINFNASPPDVDTAKPRLKYEIPNQNLLFAYQPGSLKPLALSIDSSGRWTNYNYVKLGYGSLNTPYFETGLSIGNGKRAGLNAYGQHVSSKGKIKYQDYTHTSVDLNGFLQTSGNLEFTGRFGAKEEKYKTYGYEKPSIVNVDSIRVKYQTMRSRFAMRNINRNEAGISFTPEVKLDIFTDIEDNHETIGYFNIPLRKTFEGKFEAEVAVDGGIASYGNSGKDNDRTNYISISPSLFYKSPNLYVQAGIKPTWDNSAFKLFPNAMVELSSTDKRLGLIAGWIGHMRMNTYQSAAEYNPWINPLDSLYNNSQIQEAYAGLKGSVTDHFNYQVKAGVNTFTNKALFINDTLTGRTFNVVYEPDMKSFNIHGEMGYTMGEKFSFKTGVTVNKYAGLDVNAKPWGLPQLEFTSNIRVQILKDLYAKADVYAFDETWSRVKHVNEKLPGGFDVSAGLEFAIVKNIKIWAQFNNILNTPYQRWKQYPVYGFNMLGGVVFSFAQNKN